MVFFFIVYFVRYNNEIYMTNKNLIFKNIYRPDENGRVSKNGLDSYRLNRKTVSSATQSKLKRRKNVRT